MLCDSPKESISEYVKLPPRVIVYDILPFVEIETSSAMFREFDLYGYFKLDQLRNLWMVFTSIMIDSNTRIVYYRAEKVTFLHLKRPSSYHIRRVISESDRMVNLKKFFLDFESDNEESLHRTKLLFSKQGCFPSVTKFIVSDYSYDEPATKDLSSWKNSVEFWKNLNQFESYINNFRHSSVLKNLDGSFRLQELSLDGVRLHSETNIYLPNLRKLEVFRCTGLNISVGKNLHDILFQDVNPHHIKYLFESLGHHNNIDKLVINYNDEVIHTFNESFICLRCFCPHVMKELDLEGISNITSLNFSDSLELLKISECSNFNEEIIEDVSNSLPNLQELRLRNIDSIHGRKFWPLSENIKELHVNCIPNLNRFFFQRQGFINLEVLTLYNLPLPNHRWKEMNKLQKLFIGKCTLVNGNNVEQQEQQQQEEEQRNEIMLADIFPLNGFPNLEEVNINLRDEERVIIEGITNHQNPKDILLDAIKSRKLRKIIFRGISDINDVSFQNKTHSSSTSSTSTSPSHFSLFEYLKDLRISSNPNLTGKNWSSMKSLEEIDFSRLHRMTDQFFQNESISMINRLELIELPLIKGIGWNISTEYIRDIYLWNMKEITDTIFIEHEWKNLEMIDIETCPKIKGIKWNPLPKLKDIRIHEHDFSDEHFEVDIFIKEHQEIMESIETIQICGCCLFSGHGLSGEVFQKLEKLEIAECSNFSDHNCMDFSAKNLQEIDIRRCKKFSGKGWKKKSDISNVFGTINRFLVMECQMMDDSIFQNGVLQNVIELVVYDCKNVKGKNWRNLPNLRRFGYNMNDVHFCEEFMENKPFPKTCFCSDL